MWLVNILLTIVALAVVRVGQLRHSIFVVTHCIPMRLFLSNPQS
jgi:hypothetical protein